MQDTMEGANTFPVKERQEDGKNLCINIMMLI